MTKLFEIHANREFYTPIWCYVVAESAEKAMEKFRKSKDYLYEITSVKLIGDVIV